MSVIDSVGHFRLHAVGDGKPWIKWSKDVNQLWLQYFLPVLAFDNAVITTPITFKWIGNRSSTAIMECKPEAVLNLLKLDDENEDENVYTKFVMYMHQEVSEKVGRNYKLDRCILECDDDGVALLDELNSAWVHYKLTRDWA